MRSNNKFDSNITAVNVSYFIPLEVREDMEKTLNSHEISMMFYEQRNDSFQANLFQMVILYINEHLTELFICGLLAPAAYDAVKSTIFSIMKSVAGFFRKDDKKDFNPNMKMKIGNAEIIVPIPRNLNNEQFSSYMNTLQNMLKILSENEIREIEKYECFVVEYDSETANLSVKTVTQYGLERAAEQHKTKENGQD